MPTIAGGINEYIFATGSNAAFQYGFQCREVIIIAGKTQVINEDNKFQRIAGKFIQDVRKFIKLVFLYFQKSQALFSQGIGNGFYCGAFACACVAVKQYIGSGSAFYKNLCIAQYLISFPFVSSQVFQCLHVWMLYRMDCSMTEQEGVVLCVYAIACIGQGIQVFAVIRVEIQYRCFPAWQRMSKSRVLQRFLYFFCCQKR